MTLCRQCSAISSGVLAVRLNAPERVVKHACAALLRASSVKALSLEPSCRSLGKACQAMPWWQALAAPREQCSGVRVASVRPRLPPPPALQLSSTDAAVRS